ncbi:MAG TPA: DNA polymerase III subunit beta [Gammaproteobacteria bacterium]|nr:DNA polymerase III subunit beta [Gammaproteobacteria bacterium]
MQFAILRETLLKLLRIVSGAVERRQQQNPILSNVLLRAQNGVLYVTATDQEVELIAQEPLTTISVPGETTVQFRKLYDICKALPDASEISLELQDDRVIIKSGRSRFVLATLAASSFPDVQKIQQTETLCSFSIAKHEFTWLVARTAFAMAEQDVRYFLNGMLLEVKQNKLYSVAADGHRLAMNYVALNEQALQSVRVIVPRKGILEIMRIVDEEIADLQFTISAGHIQVHCGGVTVTSKLLDGKFPDYERVIPRDGNKVVIGNREKLKEAFHRASALFSDKFRGVRLRMTPERLMILASNPEQDEVEEDLEVEYAGQDLEVGFNVRYLIDFLSVVQSDLVRFTFSDANKSTLIEEVGEGANGAYVLMPIRT